jgi:DNA-binding PadR family transcriptional regulator
MEEKGWIRAKWITTENKKRARIYQITAPGKRHLEGEEQRWQTVTAAVAHVLKHA